MRSLSKSTLQYYRSSRPCYSKAHLRFESTVFSNTPLQRVLYWKVLHMPWCYRQNSHRSKGTKIPSIEYSHMWTETWESGTFLYSLPKNFQCLFMTFDKSNSAVAFIKSFIKQQHLALTASSSAMTLTLLCVKILLTFTEFPLPSQYAVTLPDPSATLPGWL